MIALVIVAVAIAMAVVGQVIVHLTNADIPQRWTDRISDKIPHMPYRPGYELSPYENSIRALRFVNGERDRAAAERAVAAANDELRRRHYTRRQAEEREHELDVERAEAKRKGWPSPDFNEPDYDNPRYDARARHGLPFGYPNDE